MRRHLEPLAHIAFLLAALLACGTGSSKSDKAGAGDPPAAAEAATEVSPGTLISDYKGNEVRGDAKWKGKMVRLTGTVGSINKSITDSIYVVIGEDIGDNIHCNMAGGQESKAGALSKGQRATFKGRVGGLMLMSVFLEDCQIVSGAAPAAAPAKPAAAPKKR